MPLSSKSPKTRVKTAVTLDKPLTSIRRRHYEITAGVCMYVCLSVGLSGALIDLTQLENGKAYMKPKIGMMEAHYTVNP